MVKRTTTPHRMINMHGIGRLPDGQGVPHPPRPPLPLATREFVYGVIVAAATLVLMAAGIAGWLR